MFPKCVEKLAGVFAVALRMNKARADCFAGIVIGAAESKSVLLSELATCLYVSSARGEKQKAIDFFHSLRNGELKQLKKSSACGVEMAVCGYRRSKGELLILACHGITGSDATQAYMRRWNIETGFEKLKSHGFHMESSRLQGDGKMELLLAALAIAMAWSYSCGKWSAENIAPIKIKKHGRPEHSFFARGIMLLGDLLHGLAKNLRRVSLAVFGFLRAACAAQGK